MGLKRIIRYTAYETKEFKHVYPVAVLPSGEQVILDVVYKKQEGGYFNTEKAFTRKHDYLMSPATKAGLYKIGAIEQQEALISIEELEAVLAEIPDTVIHQGDGDITLMTSGQLDRKIMADRLHVVANQTTDQKLRVELLQGAAAVKTGNLAGISGLNSQFQQTLSTFIKTTGKDTKPAFQPFKICYS